MVTTPFRTTPVLGPALTQTGSEYHWDMIAGKTITGGEVAPSYPLGTKVIGNDGREYVHVTASEVITADDRVNLTEGTWTAAKSVSGTHQAVVDVADGEAFQARKYTL